MTAPGSPLARFVESLRRAFSADSAPASDEAVSRQAAALVWRHRKNRLEILLITSRGTGRWILPKGWIEGAETAAQAAIREAWEEAGIEGTLSDAPLGSYRYDKLDADDASSTPCRVDVFALRMDRQAKNWPERGERERKWTTAGKAARLVEEPELAALIEAFGAQRDRQAA
ncbi:MULTISPECIES: NUDIX hydrolase [unclassified Roseitalea]|uniref:NUDIX hydrolase n=1 Tax=unclassified Roseitalea TaxID=2639107 RepID=UPI0027402305|nr:MULTISPECIES: NUDIX hydrolase [unclassified Roseitalea]